MKKLENLNIILTVFLMLTGCPTFAQTAEELLSKAIRLEEVKGDIEEAIKTYRMVLDKYADNRGTCSDALLRMGMCYEKLGSEQARKAYSDLISRYSEQTEKVALARERITRLDAYTAELNNKAEQHLKTGNELFKRWEYEEAIKEYENAVKLVPNSLLALNARWCIGQSWYRAGKYGEAMEVFTKLIKENPKSNIAPVAELMVAQVKQVMENDRSRVIEKIQSDDNTIVDPKTGIIFRKIKTFTGESDIISLPGRLINMSPNGKYLLAGNMIVPMDGSIPFELIDSRANNFIPTRSVWSPDGRKVAFYSGDALCVVPVSPETGHATGPFKKIYKAVLKNQPSPGWSPDGAKIAYYADHDLWTIGSDGNDLKRITEDNDLEVGAVWSPDGNIIAYGSGDKNITLYNVETNEFSNLAETGHRSYPAWSPDGKWILDKWFTLHFYNLTDKSDFEFPILKSIGEFFSWQADGNKLLFYASSYKSDLFLKVAPSNGGPSFEPVPRLSSEDVAWWRNNSRLLAVNGVDEKGNVAIRIIPLSGGGSDIIHLEGLPGGKPWPLSITPGFDQIMLSVGHDNGKEDLYVVPVSAEESKTTGPPVKFFTKDRKDDIYYPSADGKKLAFVREGNIWIVYTNGDDPIKVTDLQESVEYLRWTSDCKSLLFSTSSGWKILENMVPQGKILKLTDEGKPIKCRHWNIDISPDNSKIAVLSDQQIKIIPLDETKSGKVLDISKLELKSCAELYWSPDGKSLVFTGRKEMDDKVSFPDGKFLTYNLPVDGGPPVSIAPDDDDKVKSFLSWSPDGKWIAYSAWSIAKVRPESTMWEADFKEVVEKLKK